MRRFVLATGFAALAYGAFMPASRGALDVSSCVKVTPETVATGVWLRVHNTCDVPVRCELSWRVRCDGDAADAAPRPMREVVKIASTARRELMISGAACGERVWEIRDDRWECVEVD